MLTRFWRTLFLGGALVTFVAVLAAPLYRSVCKPVGPRTMDEVAAAAEQLGLFLVHDGTAGGRVLLSEQPLTRERAATMWLHSPHHPRWIGTVAVYLGWRGMMGNYDPACSAVWGEFFLYGDPALIERLTGVATAPAACGVRGDTAHPPAAGEAIREAYVRPDRACRRTCCWNSWEANCGGRCLT